MSKKCEYVKEGSIASGREPLNTRATSCLLLAASCLAASCHTPKKK